jgi:hypothetical protein
MLPDKIERQQGMAKVVENAHEKNYVEAFTESPDVIDRQFPELDADLRHLGREACLSQIAIVKINADNAVGAPALHLDGVKAGVAANVENALPGQVGGDSVRELAPFDIGIIAKEVVWRRWDAVEFDVVKPGAELFDAALHGTVRQSHDGHS